ncbi:MAG TPA: T9SS type A sorting domain-containing protein, partial [Bacteroidales bacterium]|nr:T9SS type A sorting domain-containing protein [Bacteroidales bacterium]
VDCSNHESAILSLFNITGKLMLQKIIPEDKTTLDISTLPQGMYMITISNTRQTVIKKFFKE